MPRSNDDPLVDGSSGVAPDGTSWAEVTATINTGEYESVKIVLGRSLKVSRGKSKSTATRLLSENVDEVVGQVAAVRRAWRSRT